MAPLSIARLLSCALMLAAAATTADAAAEAHRIDYAVTVRGFPVGKAQIVAEIDDGRYSIAFSGRSVGLVRIFTDAETTASATGTIAEDAVRPSGYQHVWTEDNEVETVAFGFRQGRPADIRLDPPRGNPQRYVPLTPENMAGAIDPVSAFLWPARGGVGAELCARTIRLFDGKRRFDIALSFSRFEHFATRDGSYSGRAAVCSFRHRPVAGHRIGRSGSESIQDSEGMEAWIAPVGDGLALPLRIQFNTRLGRLVLEATNFAGD